MERPSLTIVREKSQNYIYNRKESMRFKSILLLTSMLFAIACSSPNASEYDAPEDHTVSKKGAMHKSGLKSPLENCVSCHGDDLRGGEVGVSCYHCHGKKW